MQPTTKIIPVSLRGDLRKGGYTLDFNVQGDTDLVVARQNIRPKGLSLAQYIDSYPREFFNGFVVGQPDFSFDRYSSNAQFQAATPDAFLAGEHLQDISFAAVASPANSHEATSWDFGEMVEHILRHHTSYVYDATGTNGSPTGVITTLDITSLTTFSTNEFFKVDKSTNLWRSLQQIGGGAEGGGEFCEVYFKRDGSFYYGPAAPFISPQPDARLTINKDYIKGNVRVQFNASKPGERVGQVKLTVVDVTPGFFFTSTYPAASGDGKIFEKGDGIFADSQSQSNTYAERLYKWLTRDWTIQLELDPGLVLFGDNGRGLDLGDRVLLTYNGPAEDVLTGAGVHLNLSEQSAFVYALDVRFDVHRKTATAIVTLEHDNS